MAELNIKVGVEGAEKIDALDTKLKTVEKDTESISVSTVALGNVYAELAMIAANALGSIAKAGHDHLVQMEEMNTVIAKTKDLEEGLAEAFGAASASLLESTGAWSLYRDTLMAVQDVLDGIAGRQSILMRAQKEHMEMEEEYQQMLKDRIKLEKKREEEARRAQEAELRRLEAIAQANVRHQQLVTKWEERARKEQEAYNATIEQHLELTERQVYKAELAALGYSELGDELKKTTQVTDDLTMSTIQYAEAMDRAEQEIRQAAQANREYTSSANATVSAMDKVNRSAGEIQRMQDPTGAYQRNRRTERYLREIARSSRDTNSALRGY